MGDACQGGTTWGHLQVNLTQQLNGIIIFMCSLNDVSSGDNANSSTLNSNLSISSLNSLTDPVCPLAMRRSLSDILTKTNPAWPGMTLQMHSLTTLHDYWHTWILMPTYMLTDCLLRDNCQCPHHHHRHYTLLWFIVINCAIWSTDHKVKLELSWYDYRVKRGCSKLLHNAEYCYLQ